MRIADTLGGLGYERRLKLTERVGYPVELVRVKPAGTVLGAVREKVVEWFWYVEREIPEWKDLRCGNLSENIYGETS